MEKAVNILRRGGLVAFPTETVYGLGADATNFAAVEKIFAAKGRPSTNPLIVHVADATIARRYVTAWPAVAQQLSERFWPGPLTLLLPNSEQIASNVTAGRTTVGIRVPDHPLALQLLGEFDGALAAPSANRANHISPTRAEHVRAELGDRVDLILDGGPCTVGIESTVLDISSARPTILRPGGISREQIQSLIGPVDLFEGFTDTQTAAISPGQHARHYSPVAPAFRFDPLQRQTVLQKPGAIILAMDRNNDAPGASKVIMLPDDPQTYARLLYQSLRDADAKQPSAIYIEMPPDEPRWLAVRDRLRRATHAIG